MRKFEAELFKGKTSVKSCLRQYYIAKNQTHNLKSDCNTPHNTTNTPLGTKSKKSVNDWTDGFTSEEETRSWNLIVVKRHLPLPVSVEEIITQFARIREVILMDELWRKTGICVIDDGI